MRHLRALALATLVAAGCSDIPEEAKGARVPVNACTSDAECASFAATCDATTRACRTTAAPLSVAYVISIPSTTIPHAGYTIALTREELQSCRPLARNCPTTGACFCIRRDRVQAFPTDSYRADGDVAKKGGLLVRTGPLTVPVRAAFRPLAPLIASNVVAANARVPLPLVEAEASFTDDRSRPTPGSPRPVGFRATLPIGKYLESLEPVAPFDRYFAPVVRVVDVSTDALGLEVNYTEVQTQTFQLDTGLQNVTGWKLYLRDRASGLRVSSMIEPEVGRHDVTLVTAAPVTASQIEIVLSPPVDGPVLPSMINSEVVAFPSSESLPSPLPSAVRISGLVTGEVDGLPTGIPATLLFRSAVSPLGESLLEPVNRKLRYATEARTSDSGDFSVDLPPGEYDVALVPALKSGFATSVVRGVYRSTGAVGLGFTVVPLGKLEGRVVLPSGAALPAATVKVQPALEGVAVAGAFGNLARARDTTTGADGTFSLAVDPGFYDLTVTPPASSRWPATRISSIEVPAGVPGQASDRVKLPDIALSAPYDLGFTLVTDSDSRVVPVSGALVRVFAIPAGPGKTLPVELASARTASNGRVDLYVASPK